MRKAKKAVEPQLTVVVPTRNEADNVAELVERLGAVLQGIAVEILFVDDSSDDTGAILQGMSAAPQRAGLEIRAILRPAGRRTGLGSAVTEGLKAARAPVMCVMDADLQHPPERIPALLRACEERGLDVAVASRYVPGGSARGLNGPARRLVSAGSKAVAQALFREARQTTDPLSGFFVCRRSIVEGLELKPTGFKVLLEILVCAPEARVGDVPLTFAPRHAGASNASVRQGVAYLRHLYSLLVQVPGSARSWKYAMVGVSGLVVYLLLLVLGHRSGLGTYQSWGLAFLASLMLNWQVNRIFTFADVASPFSPGRSRPVYLPAALLAGLLNLIVFSLTVGRLGFLAAGLAGAVVAMLLNYTVNRQLLQRPARIEGDTLSRDRAITERLIGQVLPAAQVVFLRPGSDEQALALAFEGHGEPPPELLRAADRRRGVLVAETPSHRAQTRHDIGMSAWAGLPVLEGHVYLGMVVAHRQGQPFSAEELNRAMQSLRSSSRDEIPVLSTLLVDRQGVQPH